MAGEDHWRVEQAEKNFLEEKKKVYSRDLLQKILEARQRRDRTIDILDYVDDGTYPLELDLGHNNGSGGPSNMTSDTLCHDEPDRNVTQPD
ncbi:hypothetical protein ZTR_04552 [Talaromyces verruculosus]|nr:hypothetical protein ZTR_04552 [Talaromyces verruculosus]